MPFNSTLSTLVVSTPLRLAYGVPLILISIPLLLAGTFLTLDRSRSFSPAHEVPPLPGAFDHAKRKWRALFGLRGGVGGLASGYVFGVQLSTFLSLWIPAISSSGPLTSQSFFAVWILSSILTTIFGGRYRYCALLFSSLCGGASLALAISVIIHPPLLARQVLVPLFSALSSAVVLVFCIPRFLHLLHPTLRIMTASSGAFSLVVAIALLKNASPWADIWERLWVSSGDAWGTSKETGLSAAYCIFTCLGIGTDWGLKRWLGECPDEKWDTYLADYAAKLPNDASRAGLFQPLPSHPLLARIFQRRKEDVIFPSTLFTSGKRHRDSLSKDSIGLLSDNQINQDAIKVPPYDEPRTSGGFLKKAGSPNLSATSPNRARKSENTSRGRKQPIKFRADFSSDSSDEDSSGAHSSNVTNINRPGFRPKSSPSSSSPTLVETFPRTGRGLLEETRSKKRPLAGGGAESALDYSDYEEDVVKKADEVRVPNFMRQHTSFSSMEGSLEVSPRPRTRGGGEKATPTPTPMAAVQATPSLIKALERVSAAQMQVFGPRHPSPSTHTNVPTPESSGAVGSPRTRLDGVPRVHDFKPRDDHDDSDHEQDQGARGPGWDEFWKDVRRKAGS